MGQLKDLKLARRPPYLRTLTDIHAPRVEDEVVNGKVKSRLTPAKAGHITILSDDENEKDHPSKSRAIKRERSHIPPRAVEHRHQSSPPRVKQEKPRNTLGRQHSYGKTSSVAVGSEIRQTHAHELSRQRGAISSPNPPSDSPSSSDSSGSDSSDSSESEDESVSSSDSSSSDGSSSEDEANASVYRPSTPPSSIGSTPAQTRRKKEADVRATSANPGTASPSRRSVQNRTSLGSGYAPLDFFIDLPSRPLPRRPELSSRSRSHTSSAIAPSGAQANRIGHSNQHRSNKSSPVVLGFMPINRVSPPPPHAPTEPRAMRTGGARPAGTPSRDSREASVPISESLSGSPSLPFRALPLATDDSQQKAKQRRGPARPGRIMQTIEQTPVDLLSPRGQPQKNLSSSPLRAATPGPSSRRTAPPQPSPGIFVTPRAVSVWPRPTPRHEDAPQTVSRSRGKRTLDETEDTDSTSKAAELERMLERIKSHEAEMEQQRAQLEDTKRLLAEQKSRIDDLEQQRRVEELVRELDVRIQTAERDVAPAPEIHPRDVATPPVAVPRHLAPPSDAIAEGAAPRRVSSRQATRKEERRRHSESQRSRARQKKRERQRQDLERQEGHELERERLKQERQEDLQLEQQLEQEQCRAAERLQRGVGRRQDNIHPSPAPIHFETEAEAQLRIQHEVFTRPLSGHNPDIRFDEDDRPNISKATAFLMRLPQTFVLSKLRQLVEGRAFFDLAHPGSVYMGCWVVSKRASCDMRMKLVESGEKHGFSFERLAVRLWHDEQSIYTLLQHGILAARICHTERCMRPDHIVVEPKAAAAERRRCKRNGRCPGHRTVHKDGTRQARKRCIFPPRGVFVRL